MASNLHHTSVLHPDVHALQQAAEQIVAMLDRHDSDAIRAASAQLHLAIRAVAHHGGWHTDVQYSPGDPHALKSTLDYILKYICAAEYRVRFLTDFARQRHDILTQSRPYPGHGRNGITGLYS